MHLTKQRHEQRGLAGAGWTDYQVYASPFENQLVVDVQLEATFGSSWSRAPAGTTCVPRESHTLDTNGISSEVSPQGCVMVSRWLVDQFGLGREHQP